MEDNGIQDKEVIDDFHFIVVHELMARITKLQAHQGAAWQDFKKALKEEYFLEDSQWVTKESFMKWIKQQNKGISTLSCFENLKRETIDEELKDKLATLKHKLEELVFDDLVKGIQELSLNLKAVKLEERGRVSRGKLCEAGNSIRETTGWSDPVDLLSMYAYIAKSEANEAWVEEKQKRDEETAGPSKRATRPSNKKEEVLKPSPEVNMEDAPKDKKQCKPRGPSYKFKSLTLSWLQI
ncbi:hypothetical protein L7F22_057537 [Adiantum nelumboides]|nr:hypothetical protein [Adiantum nelumboides]